MRKNFIGFFFLSLFLFLFLFLFLVSNSYAAMSSGVEFSVGGLLGQTSADQTGLNSLRENANLTQGGIGTSALTSAWELGAFMRWKWDWFGFELRPSYFTQSEAGTGSAGGDYNYSVKGMTFAGLYKLYPLENDFMRFFVQLGVNWGGIAMSIEENGFNVKANGHNLGYQAGAGVDLTFDVHVISVEVGWRWLNIERNMVSSTSGTPYTGSPLTQYADAQELEKSGNDLGSLLTGTQMFLGYSYRF